MANIELSDPKHFDEFNAVREAWVRAGAAPTRACVQALLTRHRLDRLRVAYAAGCYRLDVAGDQEGL